MIVYYKQESGYLYYYAVDYYHSSLFEDKLCIKLSVETSGIQFPLMISNVSKRTLRHSYLVYRTL